MKYVYPAIFTIEDDKYLVSVPDLSGCHTFGDSLADAIDMTRDAMAMWLCLAEDGREAIPAVSDLETIHPGAGFVTLVDADTAAYRRMNDNRAVKKTLTLPSWLNAQGEAAGVNFSQVLQEALKARLDAR